MLAQRAWLLGAAWQIGNQSRSVMPTLNDCLAMRINSAAGEPITSVIVLVNNMGIPERRWKTRLYEPVPKCRGCSPPSTTTCNSYAKGIHRNEMDQNIVNVIVTERHCHPQEVVVTAMAMRDRITCRFLCLRDRIAHRQSTPTRLYLQDLGHVVRGNRGRRGCGRATQRRACLGRAQGRRPGVPGPAGTSGRPSASGPRQRPWPSEWVAGQIARARALAAQAQVEGRYLGGRPPYGYQVVDAGPHPNPAKAAEGKRLKRLTPDPITTPVVQRIFHEYLMGIGIYALAQRLTADGIPSPSAYDPNRNKHRSGLAWSKSAVRTILGNPRYTGYQV